MHGIGSQWGQKFSAGKFHHWVERGFGGEYNVSPPSFRQRAERLPLPWEDDGLEVGGNRVSGNRVRYPISSTAWILMLWDSSSPPIVSALMTESVD